jgi:signal transduction histidine kinase
VPIIVGGEVFGVFGVNYMQPRRLDAEEQRVLLGLAQRAALAIENARLYEQSQQAAALEERQRLARELHDAVTQTLFSASLIAEVIPRLNERRPEEARKRIEDLRRLTRGALAEMRTLLLELRPTALTESKLGELLRQQAEALTSKSRFRIDVEVTDDQVLPPDAQVTLYRIAQEALNNIVKHADASQVQVSLRCGRTTELCISDNGKGFDAATAGQPGHFGVGFMRERAEAIGATLEIHSSPGAGTRVVLTWGAA